MRQAKRETVTLTPTEIKAVERALGAKAQLVVRALRAAGLVGAAKSSRERQRRNEPTRRPSGLMTEVIDLFWARLDRKIAAIEAEHRNCCDK